MTVSVDALLPPVSGSIVDAGNSMDIVYVPDPVSMRLISSSRSSLSSMSGGEVGAFVNVGCRVGSLVGIFVGEFVGELVGEFVGELVGESVGEFVGEFVGELVGELDGTFVGPLVVGVNEGVSVICVHLSDVQVLVDSSSQ